MKKILLLLITFANLYGQEPSLTDKIEEYVQAAGKVWGFTGAVLVSLKGDPVYVNGIGKASYQLSVPNDSNNVFRIGALTKPFTATAVMQLAQKGLLELNSPIVKYLEDYPGTSASKITVQQLLSNTSGIPDYINDPQFKKNLSQPMAVSDIVNIFANQPLKFEPGTKFDFSNSNYILLGLIVSYVSGIPYEAYINDRIVSPLGLKSTGYFNNSKIIPKITNGYSMNADNQIINAPCLDNSRLFSSGGLYSNVGDLFIWSQALLSNKVIGPYMGKLMFTPNKGNYGLGWYIDGPKTKEQDLTVKNFGKLHYWHDGEIDGFLSLLSIFPEENVNIIILSNNDYAFKNTQIIYNLHDAIASIIFKLPYVLPMESILYHSK